MSHPILYTQPLNSNIYQSQSLHHGNPYRQQKETTNRPTKRQPAKNSTLQQNSRATYASQVEHGGDALSYPREILFLFYACMSESATSDAIVSSFSGTIQVVPTEPNVSTLFSVREIVVPFELRTSAPVRPPSNKARALGSLICF